MSPKLLLNSDYSDDFDLGYKVKEEHKNRIIKVTTKIDDISNKFPSIQDLANYFKSQDRIDEDSRILPYTALFFLDRFIDKNWMKSFRYKPGTIKNVNDVKYKFCDNGRMIAVYDKNKNNPKKLGQVLTQIDRIFKIEKNKKTHAVICEPRIGKQPDTQNIKNRIYYSKKLIGSNANLISYMKIMPIDSFRQNYNKKMKWDKSSQVKYFLDFHPNNLVMVYSKNCPYLLKIGTEARELMYKQNTK